MFWFFYLFKNFYFVSDVAVDETRDTSKDENSKTESHTNEQIMKSDRLSDCKVIENACEEHVNHQRENVENERHEVKTLYRPHEIVQEKDNKMETRTVSPPRVNEERTTKSVQSENSERDSRIESPTSSKSPGSPIISRQPASSNSYLSKDFSSPPNVTIVQPSVSHSMFPFFYPYSSTSSGMPYSINPMLLPGNPSLPPGLQLPFIATSRHSEMGHLSPSHSHAHALSTLNQLTLQSHMLSQSYSSLNSDLGGNSSVSPNQISNTTVGSIFPSRTNPRYSPYSLPSSKTFVPSTSPISASGNPLRNEPEVSGISRPSPIRPRSPLGHHLPFPGLSNSTNPNNELRHMERMLNVLDRKRVEVHERTMADVH